MNKHTPGPWVVEDDEVYADRDCEHHPIFVLSGFDCRDEDERNANLQLAAAAPDLLEALEGVMRMIKWAKENDDSPKSALSHFISSEPVFAAAITKATGA